MYQQVDEWDVIASYSDSPQRQMRVTARDCDGAMVQAKPLAKPTWTQLIVHNLRTGETFVNYPMRENDMH